VTGQRGGKVIAYNLMNLIREQPTVGKSAPKPQPKQPDIGFDCWKRQYGL
jgi:hypothetical protein